MTGGCHIAVGCLVIQAFLFSEKGVIYLYGRCIIVEQLRFMYMMLVNTYGGELLTITSSSIGFLLASLSLSVRDFSNPAGISNTVRSKVKLVGHFTVSLSS